MKQRHARQVVAKALEAGSFSTLTEEELALLEQFSRRAEQKKATEAAPSLWVYQREQVMRWCEVFEVKVGLDSEVRPVLAAAGVPENTLSGSVRALAAPVERSALVQAVRQHIEGEQPRYEVLRFAGDCGLHELERPLAEVATACGYEGGFGTERRLKASMEALAMIGSERALEVARLHARHQDEYVRRSAYAVLNLAADKLTDEEILELVTAESDPEVLGGCPELLLRAARAGAEISSPVEKIVEEVCLGAPAIARLAEIIISLHDPDLLGAVLDSDDDDVIQQILLRLCWSDERWAAPVLGSRLAKWEDEDTEVLAVAAAATLAENTPAWLGGTFSASSWYARTGAAMACLTLDAFEEQLDELLKDDDDDVARVARCVRVLRAEGAGAARHPDVRAVARHNDPVTALLPRALEVLGATDDPDIEESRLHHSGDPDRELRFYRAHPGRLAKQIRQKEVYFGMTDALEPWERACVLAGLVGGSACRAALDLVLDACDDLGEARLVALNLECLGGPLTQLGRFHARLALAGDPGGLELDKDDSEAATLFALRDAEGYAGLLLESSHKLRSRAEPMIASLLESRSERTRRAAASALTRLDAPTDPLLAEVAALLSGDLAFDEIEHLDWLVLSRNEVIRSRLVAAAGRAGMPAPKLQALLARIAHDDDGPIALAKVQALIDAGAGDSSEALAILIELSRDSDWALRRAAVNAMARSGSAAFVPRLLEMLADETDSDVKKACIKALRDRSTPLSGSNLIVMQADEPREVAREYGLTDDWDYSADDVTEALRLLLLALTRRKDERLAREHLGRRVYLSTVTGTEDLTGDQKQLTRAELEGLAVYLEVLFVDEETGAILAGVTDEETGQVLNALFEGGSPVVFTATWS